LSTDTSAARTRAEANFRKEERAKDGAKAMMEYQAQNAALREKTAKLRALRLAKEAEEAKEAEAKEAKEVERKAAAKPTGRKS
jgi:hypothetical protein